MLQTLTAIGWVVLVLVANALAVLLTAAQLPGTWVMVLVMVGYAWMHPGTIGWPVLAAMALLAMVGEVLEFVSSSAGARRAGGSRRGAVLAIVGAVIGAIVGTVLLPVPIIGTIVGGCVGAGVGSLTGDRLAGRSWDAAWRAGQGAAKGKLWGTLIKVAVAAIMWLVAAAAVFWP